ncbi:YheC/YheD family endospore coat-associated protein [Effusibacillus dendaii]|uniref:ATP-grasp domain-containing protein n=1 Tax=Effusibacillus dendaii TaxID=2743772 RepID=A0A7I8DCG2_9BACL|nr:YheC/YheD family protein [Effusibacillus dendaii]BCJ87775.1 hypothetical protein skT53_27600 [Effusibacillus dendaii]
MKHKKCFAIVTTSVPSRTSKRSQFRPGYAFRMMALEGEKRELLTVLVHPKDFDWETRRIFGWVGLQIGTEAESWKQVKLRLPDVVYDNVYVHLVNKGMTRTIRNNCRRLCIPLFNPFVPNKLRVNQFLIGKETVKSYIPETKYARKPQDVFTLLDRFHSVYVKPTGGYGGKGVTRISHAGTGLYHLRADRLSDKQGHFERTMNRSELQSWLSHRLQIRHIVQQGLNLIQVDGGQIDFRVVVQRNDQGKWQLVGIIPKIAAAGGVVTNLIAGGRKTSFQELMLGHPELSHVGPLLEKAAIEIAQVLSIRYPTLCLLGFDMGVDREGKVWMIELNSKPARSLLAPSMQRLSSQLVTAFADYL